MSDLDTRIDQALARRFRPPNDAELSALVRGLGAPVRRFPSRFFALAAAAVLAALGWTFTRSPLEPATPDPLALAMCTYHENVSAPSDAGSGSCISGHDWIQAALGEGSDVRLVRFVDASELGFPTCAVLEVRGAVVTLFVAPAAMDPAPGPATGSGLRLFRTEGGGRVLYELTTLESAEVTSVLLPGVAGD
jgi:hypothetical protein